MQITVLIIKIMETRLKKSHKDKRHYLKVKCLE